MYYSFQRMKIAARAQKLDGKKGDYFPGHRNQSRASKLIRQNLKVMH